MYAIFLFAFYFILISLFLTRNKKIKRAGLDTMVLWGAFAFKVLLGCAYGYIFLKYYGGDDTWLYHRQSLEEYSKLIHHPVAFGEDLLPFDAFDNNPGFWEGLKWYITDLEYWFVVKLLAFFNIFSRGNYYINVLFFDFFVFSGPLLLFKLLSSVFPGKKTVLTIVLFFVPSLTFWLSGIRSEGLLLLAFAVAVYYAHQYFLQKRHLFLWFSLAGLTGMLIFRPQFLFTFIPALLSWILCRKHPQKATVYFFIVYASAILIFFSSISFSATKNLPMTVVKKQQDFFQLHGNTRLALDSLQPSVTSFVTILPEAISNTFLRPFIWEAKGPLQWAAAISSMGCWVLLLMVVLFPEKNSRKLFFNPLLLLFLFYSISQVVLIGYTVPFPGAIVRYKIIPDLLLILYFSIIINWGTIFIRLRKYLYVI